MNRKLALSIVLFAAGALADEGMWTLDNFPHAAVEKKYGIEVTDAWLRTVKRSVARLDSGCSGSFVSADGLVLTNHHCALSCIAQNSSVESDLEAGGFLASGRAEELVCPTDRISVLIETEEITSRIAAATAGKDEVEAGERRRQLLKQAVQSCEEESALKCESVSLYGGGQHWLYKYKRYEDVRLVFAPEGDIAAFGGDPDNFNFPRWCLDMTLLRVYEDNKPAATPNFLTWRNEGLQPGEAMFVAGHPGRTQRLLTVADLKFRRDITLPQWLLRNVELRGRYIQYASAGGEAFRTTQAPLQRIENGIKVQRKRLDALHDDDMLTSKLQAERALQAAVASDPELAAEVGSAWADIERAKDSFVNFRDDYYFIEAGAAFSGRLFDYARTLLRKAAEQERPDAERLRPYTAAALPRTRQLTLAARPFYPELEKLQLSFSLDKMREILGPDSPFVRQILGNKTPAAVATELVEGSELADPKVRARLWDADLQTLRAADDPMIKMALALDGAARALRKRYEDEVEAPTDLAYERIAKARFAVNGTSDYPDATFTLRVSYGAHEGWLEKGEPVRPWTTLDQLFPRVTGEAPFQLPESWADAKDTLAGSVRFNFVGTTDIIGGNSGSPVIDKNGNLVGLVFDGNIHSISGSYWFDDEKNRTVAVHPEVMIESMRSIYGATHLLEEMGVSVSR